ncbi:hypothetical protein HPB51_010824 [Rhipicephalus microplus]|uniref:Tick transposon n=1 Tax=Rhipicephalus microplus TaxID=6941 RepID=A0A9J6DMG1_RHIMP|nr:hypothetical protein HPB51_010824 [Rhipicephalus microplus]
MYAAIPLPMFLQCPGSSPIPWRHWHPVLQVYIDATARDATPEHKKALLQNALGVEGLNSYLLAVKDEPIPAVDHVGPADAVQDAYAATLQQLDNSLDLVIEEKHVNRALQQLDALSSVAVSSRHGRDSVTYLPPIGTFVLLQLLRKPVPSAHRLRLLPRLPARLTPVLQRRRRLTWERASPAVCRSTGWMLTLARRGHAPVCVAEEEDTSEASADPQGM